MSLYTHSAHHQRANLAWITTGCDILGTGGGGSPYSNMLRMRSMLRNGSVIRVINPCDLEDEDLVSSGGGAGSPTVGIEKLAGESIIDSVGGPETGRMGRIYGEVVIESAAINDAAESSISNFPGKIKIPFKNENIAAVRMPEGTEVAMGDEKNEDVLAIVPDLISVVDAQNGEAIGTPEYRYGLLVVVIGVTDSERWTNPRGVELGGPKAFGLDHLEYKPLGQFVKPVSAIDEYDGKS